MNDYNTVVNESDTKFIYEGCAQMIPSIKNAKIIDEMVGLRPGRSYVRLEQDTYTTSKIILLRLNIHTYPINLLVLQKKSFLTTGERKCLQIIHNYGHGGAGITLSYGCAVEVCEIICKHLRGQKYTHNCLPKNKL